MKLALAAIGLLWLCTGWGIYRRQRRPKPITKLRREEDRMSPRWIVQHCYEAGQEGDQL